MKVDIHPMYALKTRQFAIQSSVRRGRRTGEAYNWNTVSCHVMG